MHGNRRYVRFCQSAVPVDLGVDSVKELAAKITNKLNYASVTGSNDLMFAAFLKTEHLEMAKVPYKDPVSAINDLSEGRIHAFVGAYAIMRPRILAKKVKAIALTNLQHAAALRDIPTGRELGYRSLEFDGLVGILGPRNMPQAARDRIAADIAAEPEVVARVSAGQSGVAERIRRRARRTARGGGGDRQGFLDQTGAIGVGNDSLSLTNSLPRGFETSLKKLLAFLRV